MEGAATCLRKPQVLSVLTVYLMGSGPTKCFSKTPSTNTTELVLGEPRAGLAHMNQSTASPGHHGCQQTEAEPSSQLSLILSLPHLPVLNLSWGPGTHQTLSSTSRGVKAGSRAKMQTHFQAGLLEAPTILPQLFLTLFPRSSQHQQNLCVQLPHICALPTFSLLPALPPASSPHCANVNKNHFHLQPKPSQLPLKIFKKIFPQIQKEALSSVSVT